MISGHAKIRPRSILSIIAKCEISCWSSRKKNIAASQLIFVWKSDLLLRGRSLFGKKVPQLLQLLCEADSREEMERISTRKWLTALIPNDGIIRDLLSYRKELKTVFGTRASLD